MREGAVARRMEEGQLLQGTGVPSVLSSSETVFLSKLGFELHFEDPRVEERRDSNGRKE